MLPGVHFIIKHKRFADAYISSKFLNFTVKLDVDPKSIFSKKFISRNHLFAKDDYCPFVKEK